MAVVLSAKFTLKEDLNMTLSYGTPFLVIKENITFNSHPNNRLRLVVKCAQRYGLPRLDGFAIIKTAARKMPTGYQPEDDKAIRKMNHKKDRKCLRDAHKVRTIGQADIELGDILWRSRP
jgi:hypothetical protein